MKIELLKLLKLKVSLELDGKCAFIVVLVVVVANGNFSHFVADQDSIPACDTAPALELFSLVCCYGWQGWKWIET